MLMSLNNSSIKFETINGFSHQYLFKTQPFHKKIDSYLHLTITFKNVSITHRALEFFTMLKIIYISPDKFSSEKIFSWTIECLGRVSNP